MPRAALKGASRIPVGAGQLALRRLNALSAIAVAALEGEVEAGHVAPFGADPRHLDVEGRAEARPAPSRRKVIGSTCEIGTGFVPKTWADERGMAVPHAC